jgi:DNA-binding PadR family transcriptional regulator
MADVLGAFEQAVLLAVLRLREHAYGRGILHEVQERLEREISAGAVYATLDRLEAKGFAGSKVAPGTAARGGRTRRYYHVSSAGLRALAEAKAAIDNIWREVPWPLKSRA